MHVFRALRIAVGCVVAASLAPLAGLGLAVISAAPASAQCPNSGSNCTVTSGSLLITSVDSYSGTTNVGSGTSLEISGTGGLQGGGEWTNNGTLIIDAGGFGYSSGSGGLMGTVAGSSTLTISGGSSSGLDGFQLYFTTNHFTIGTVSGATGTVTISNGGSLFSSDDSIGDAGGSTGTVVVTGSGSNWTDNHQMLVGNNGTGNLTVENGGSVAVETSFGDNAYVGEGAGGVGTLTVTGSGSSYAVVNSSLFIGDAGTGILTVASGGTVTVGSGSGTIYVANQIGSTGTINIGAAAGQTAVAPGTISASTISFGSGTGSIVFNHTSTDYTFSPVITGAGAAVVDAGTTVLTATNSYTGATTINGGTLEVDGSIGGSSAVTVNAGATLSGTGTVGGPLATTTINNGGKLSPGSLSAPAGTLSIGNNLVFNSGSEYAIYLTPSQHSSTNVADTTTINGGSVVLTLSGALGASYSAATVTILNGTGARSGTFNSQVGYSGALQLSSTPTLSYVGNNVDLTYGNSAVDLAAPAGANANQQNVINAINNAVLAGDTIRSGLQQLANLSGTALLNAYSQLDGESASGAQNSGFTLMNEFMELISGESFAAAGPTGSGGLRYASEQELASLPPDLALAFGSVLETPSHPSAASGAASGFDQRWSAWGTGYGGGSITDGSAGSNNVTTATYGTAAGMEYRADPNTVLGFALAGGGLNWSLAQGLGGGRADSFQAGAYGKSRFGPAYLSVALGFGNDWFTTTRSALGDQLTASFTGQSYAARVEGGYRYSLSVRSMSSPASAGGLGWGAIGITPYAAVQTQWLHTPNYSETDLSGGGLGLAYSATSADDTRSEIGARFDDLATVNSMPLLLRARVGWAHDWVSGTTLNAAFESLPGSNFTVNGAPIPRNSALTGASAQYWLTPDWSFTAKFDGEFAPTAQTYAGSGTLRYAW